MSKPLLNTSFPQSDDFVFDPQSSTPNEQHPRGVVRQDKTAPARDRVASVQPASPKNTARPHHMDGKISRLHRRSTKRKTVPGTIHFSPEEKIELQRLADSE